MKPLALFLLAAVLQFNLSAADALDEKLKPLEPFLGAWKGEFKNSTSEKPIIDIARWERVLNGKAVRIVHSINDGAYGGETIIMWDPETQRLTYWYFTTAGFRTTGTMTATDNKLVTHEKVSGSANGATEVRSTYILQANDTIQNKAEYLVKGSWDSGREVLYKRAPEAKVVFK